MLPPGTSATERLIFSVNVMFYDYFTPRSSQLPGPSMLGPYNGILDNKQINYNFCFFDTLQVPFLLEGDLFVGCPQVNGHS